MKKILSIAILSLFSLPVFATTSMPTTPADVDLMINSVRDKPHTVRLSQCKTDMVMLKAVAKDYYNSNMGPVEKWKSEIEKSRALSVEEKKDYDYVKKAFTLEKTSPKYRSWYVCDEAMDIFKKGIVEQKDSFIKNKDILLKEYDTASMTTVNTDIQTFFSVWVGKTIAVVNSNNTSKNVNTLSKYDFIIKVSTNKSGQVTKKSVMALNNIVNNKSLHFYGTQMVSISVLSLQKVYAHYVSTSNSRHIDMNGWTAVYPSSTRVGNIYYIEM